MNLYILEHTSFPKLEVPRGGKRLHKDKGKKE